MICDSFAIYDDICDSSSIFFKSSAILAEGKTPPSNQASKRGWSEKFAKISKVYRIFEEYFRVLPPHQKS